MKGGLYPVLEGTNEGGVVYAVIDRCERGSLRDDVLLAWFRIFDLVSLSNDRLSLIVQ